MTTATKAATNGKGKTSGVLELPALEIQRVRITIESFSSLITHQFSEKARKEMEDKQGGKANTGRKAKNPEEEFRASLYVVPGKENDPDEPGKFYFPAIAFKSAAIGGCRTVDGLTMAGTKGLFFVDADPILRFREMRMRQDTVRLESGVADLRYRGEFLDWSCDLNVSFNSRAITLAQIVNLFNVGGFSIGVGEWRPTPKKGQSGNHGRFTVTAVEEL